MSHATVDLPLYQSIEAFRVDVVGQARASGTFAVEDVVINDEAIITIRGAVDRESIPHLQAVIDGLIALNPKRLIIDLSAATYVSSHGVAALADQETRVDELMIRMPKTTSVSPSRSTS